MTITIDSQIELRQLRHSDATDIFNTIDTQRVYLGEWLPFVAFTKELTDTQKFVESVMEAPEERFEYVFTIRKAGEFAGLIGFKDTDRLNRKSELGYWLAEGFQKQGIVTRSVQRLCQFAFEELDLNRIQIKCATGNTASNNIPQRLGFRFEGIERDGELLTGHIYTDLAVYSRLKSDSPNELK